MRRTAALLVALVGALALAQALPGQNNGRISRAPQKINPPPCDAGYVYTSAFDGGIFTCVQLGFNQLTGQPPPCDAGYVYTSVFDGGIFGCVQIGFNQLTGTPLAGGSVPQVQYNADGGLGGITNVISDGVHEEKIAVGPAQPAAPALGLLKLYGFELDGGFPIIPLAIDGYFQIPVPSSVSGVFTMFGTSANWQTTCAFPGGWGNNSIDAVTNPPVNGTTAITGTPSGPAWADTSLYTRSRVLRTIATSGAASAQVAVIYNNLFAWRGDSAGAGGFLYWTRVAFDQASIQADGPSAFFGLISRATIINGGSMPSANTDCVYVGADRGQTPLQICSNDNVGTATCNSLGSNFSLYTSGAIYDIWLSAAPNAASIEYAVVRLDTPAIASGSITSDLPRNTVQLNWQAVINNGDGGIPVALGWEGQCTAYNY